MRVRRTERVGSRVRTGKVGTRVQVESRVRRGNAWAMVSCNLPLRQSYLSVGGSNSTDASSNDRVGSDRSNSSASRLTQGEREEGSEGKGERSKRGKEGRNVEGRRKRKEKEVKVYRGGAIHRLFLPSVEYLHHVIHHVSQLIQIRDETKRNQRRVKLGYGTYRRARVTQGHGRG